MRAASIAQTVLPVPASQFGLSRYNSVVANQENSGRDDALSDSVACKGAESSEGSEQDKAALQDERLVMMRIRITLYAALGFSWTIIRFAPALIWIIVLIPVLIIVFSKSSRLALLGLVLSPLIIVPIYSIAVAAIDYSRDEGALHYRGLPRLEFYNVDREYRCRNVSSCVVVGNEALTIKPYNFALRTLITKLGPMRGSYTGHYPTREEAFRLIRESGDYDDGLLFRSSEGGIKLQIGNMTYKTSGSQYELLMYYRYNIDEYISVPLKAVKLDGHCVLLSVREESPDYYVFLFDLDNESIFAIYDHEKAKRSPA